MRAYVPLCKGKTTYPSKGKTTCVFTSFWSRVSIKREREVNKDSHHKEQHPFPWQVATSQHFPACKERDTRVSKLINKLTSTKPAIVTGDVLIFPRLKVCHLIHIAPHSTFVTALYLLNERSLGEKIKYASNSEELISFLSTHVKPEHPFNVKDL